MTLKPFLIYNYPESKNDNIAVANKLQEVFNEYYTNKRRLPVFADSSTKIYNLQETKKEEYLSKKKEEDTNKVNNEQ